MATRVMDFDKAYQEIHKEPDEQSVVIYKGEEHPIGDIPVFTQMRMAALSSGNYDTVNPEQVEQMLDMLKGVCPSLSDEMETWDMDQFRAFMSIFAQEDEDPNASTVPEEESAERSESPVTVTD